MFYFKYFMMFVIIIELMMSYTIISSAYIGYKKQRVKFNRIVLLSILMIVILLITLGIIVFV
ncbi:MAG: hypothetical protein GX275_05495 [Clostridiales bacterium]|nr:hypothetical protein [Clostridiales bacterium]